MSTRRVRRSNKRKATRHRRKMMGGGRCGTCPNLNCRSQNIKSQTVKGTNTIICQCNDCGNDWTTNKVMSNKEIKMRFHNFGNEL
jgi:hypothetical protein